MIISDAAVTALVVGIPAFFTGLASLIIAWRNSDKIMAGNAQTDAVEHKADKLIEQGTKTHEQNTEIHTLTNSTLSTTTAALAVANARLEGMERLVLSLSSNPNMGKLPESVTNPVPVVDDKVANKIDQMVTPKLDKIQETVDDGGE